MLSDACQRSDGVTFLQEGLYRICADGELYQYDFGLCKFLELRF